MSVETWLAPERAPKEQLCALLRARGYERFEHHFFLWPEGTASYYWRDDTDYRSASGVEADVYWQADEGSQPGDGKGRWALHTRTRASASSFDLMEQNELVREARRAFGGSFYNDAYGRNRYTPVARDVTPPAVRGVQRQCNAAYETLH